MNIRYCPHETACLACSHRKACLSREIELFIESLRGKVNDDKELLIYVARKHLKLKCKEMGEIFKMDPSTAWRIAERAAEKKAEWNIQE